MKKLFTILTLLVAAVVHADNGYDLWLRYQPVNNNALGASYKTVLKQVSVIGNSATTTIIKNEIDRAASKMLGLKPAFNISSALPSMLVATNNQLAKNIRLTGTKSDLLGNEGYYIFTHLVNGKSQIVVTANTDIGLLYGVFHLLQQMQQQRPVKSFAITSVPKLNLRLLNHWDNLDRTVERGYAGFSIWNWHTLPGYIDQRYIDYARANASIGINGTVLTNVNANATILTPAYLQKVKALADVFRPYGIKVYLTARFSAPIEMGGLKTADPLDEKVKQWWQEKANEIYSLIPDFGGFLVKANSEGQPGPQDYKRTHADGANMLADAVAPHNGIVIWRAFVYAAENPVDRHKQAYDDFKPLDGSFRKNVLVQVKNGAIDFMPREPFHPLFGAMPATPLMMEFQITQEYTGQATSLVYLAPMYKEVLQSDTRAGGKTTTVADVLKGKDNNHTLNGMAGVANIGNDINWCGHPFAQSNWYAYGSLCWDNAISSESIAEDWLRMTFTNNESFIASAKTMMMNSRETMVNYMNPLGLHHIMSTGHHYGPAPWVSNLSRPEWNPVYYHKADAAGIGFNRTSTGSNALSQYHPEVQKNWENMETIDEKYLLWFHHAPWTKQMKSGRNLWEEMCFKYYQGAAEVAAMQKRWNGLEKYVDQERHSHVRQLLKVQYDEAIWWRNACLLYFSQFSKMPIPAQYEQPGQTLEYYQQLKFPFAPGN